VQISAEFVTSAAGAGDFPRDRLAEVALVGRSNVGKSSLINALVKQKVARTSGAPGKTRLANFYRVQRGSAPAFYLVDLPGYGYARAPRGSGQGGRDAATREFSALTGAYFARDKKDIAVLLLVDARHPGLESDLDAWAWVRSQPCRPGVIGTKADKLTRADRERHARQLASLFDIPVPLVSAQTGEGLDELWKVIATTNRTAP
jgi:GTP-binding protein